MEKKNSKQMFSSIKDKAENFTEKERKEVWNDKERLG